MQHTDCIFAKTSGRRGSLLHHRNSGSLTRKVELPVESLIELEKQILIQNKTDSNNNWHCKSGKIYQFFTIN
jgi:hypothetical protein